MERVGEEGVVRALVSLDQGVKLREPAVAQTAPWVQKRREGWSKQSSFQNEGDMIPWSPGKEGLLCGTWRTSCLGFCPCNREELVLVVAVRVLKTYAFYHYLVCYLS